MTEKNPIAIVVPVTRPVAVMAPAAQGLPGRPGVGGADISEEPDNRLEALPDGLYVAPHEWELNQW